MSIIDLEINVNVKMSQATSFKGNNNNQTYNKLKY